MAQRLEQRGDDLLEQARLSWEDDCRRRAACLRCAETRRPRNRSVLRVWALAAGMCACIVLADLYPGPIMAAVAMMGGAAGMALAGRAGR